MRPTGNRTSSHFSDMAEIQIGPKAHPVHRSGGLLRIPRLLKRDASRDARLKEIFEPRKWINSRSNDYRRASSTELAAMCSTHENTGELAPHLASQLILRVFQNLVMLGLLQQSLAGHALSQVQPKREIGHEECDSPFSLKSVRDGSGVRCGI